MRVMGGHPGKAAIVQVGSELRAKELGLWKVKQGPDCVISLAVYYFSDENFQKYQEKHIKMVIEV